MSSALNIIQVAALVSLALLHVSKAAAFDVDGFKVGMTIEEAQALAHRQGFSLTNRKDNPWPVFETTLSKDQKLAFCNEQLFGYSKPLKDLTAFIRSLTQMTRDLGRGEYSSQGYDSPISPESIFTMYVNWQSGDEEIGLKAQQFNSKEYFTITWLSKNDCDKSSK
ncbi:MAG TPA: hypothetical protein VEK82_04675 [Stellaceae bacterium]|nr:hypothetical protein [Stellaceae bacterium]